MKVVVPPGVPPAALTGRQWQSEMNQTQNKQFNTNTSNRLFLALGAAATLAAMALPTAARAGDDKWPGLNAPHQERNPSDSPERFVFAPRQAPERFTVTVTDRTAARQDRQNPVIKQTAFVTAPTVVGATTPAVRPTTVAVAEAIGSGAPHQERNPSASPELWVR